MPGGILILVDPVTEWKDVLHAAKHRLKTTTAPESGGLPAACIDEVIAVTFSETPLKLRPFLPATEMLLEAGIDHVVTMHQRDVSACVRDIQVLLKQINESNHPSRDTTKVLGVVPLSEMAVDVSDLLAACLGVPHNFLDRLTSRRDKGIMKDVVSKAGLRVAKHIRVSNQTDLKQAMMHSPNDRPDFNVPIVIKTPQGFSTTDVFVCSTMQDAETAMETICGSFVPDLGVDHSRDNRLGPDGRPVNHAILEEYIDGTEFAVNLMVLSGQLSVTDVWRYDKTDTAQYLMAEHCNPHNPALADIVVYATNVAHAVGIRVGAAHVELKATRGDDSMSYRNPIMIEVGARLSGGRKASMTQSAIPGWDPFLNLILSHCGLPSNRFGSENSFAPTKWARHLFLPVERSGTVREVRLDVEGCSTVEAVSMMVKVGDVVQKTSDIVSCAGFVWLIGNEDQVKEDTIRIRNRYEILFD